MPDGDEDGSSAEAFKQVRDAIMALVAAAQWRWCDNVEAKDMTELKGYDKSTKHWRAESLMAQDTKIKAFSERDFLDLMGLSGP